MISPISLMNLPSVQKIQPVTRKLLPDEEEAGKKGRQNRQASKKASASRESISVTSDSAQLRSSSAVQAALTDLKRDY
jgi:hypothetical protein